MALFSRIALIALILVIVFYPFRSVSLITFLLVTFLFAIILAFGVRDNISKDVLTTTTAYIIILVVFIRISIITLITK